MIEMLRRPKGSRLVSLLCREKRTGVKAGSLTNLCYPRWKSLAEQKLATINLGLVATESFEVE